MPANGATATSSAVAGNVRFKAVAELTSMAEMGRKAAIRFRIESKRWAGDSARK